MMKQNEITIKGNVLNTSIEEHRQLLGNYGEILLSNFFIKYNLKFKYMNDDNKYSRYDFKLELNDNLYIIELKTRIGHIDKHNIEILDYNKVHHYLYLKKVNNNIKFKIIFIFNHIEGDDNYNFYYYEIDDINEFENITFLNDKFKNKFYELPIRYLKPIEELIMK